MAKSIKDLLANLKKTAASVETSLASKISDNQGWYRKGRFTPMKQIGDFNPTGNMSLKQSLAQLPQHAESYWSNAGIVKDNPLLQRYAPWAIKPLSTAVQLGPASYMKAMSKGASTFARDTTGWQKAGDIAGVVGANNPAYAQRNLISGPLGAGFTMGKNLFSGDPLTKDLTQGWEGGQEFGFKTNVISEFTRPVTEAITRSIPALNFLTNKAIENGSKVATDATFKQAFRTWLSTAGKKMLRAATAETLAETPVYAAITKDDRGEGYIEAIQREAVENLVMNVGFAGFDSVVDATKLTPLIKKSVGDAIQNYKDIPIEQKMAGKIDLGAKIGGEKTTAMDWINSPEYAKKMAEIKAMRSKRKPTKTSNNLYHVTPVENLESIRQGGLTTGNKPRFEGVSGSNNISFSANEATAKYYGSGNDVMIRTKTSYKPKDLELDLLAGGEGTYITHQNIPPEMLEVKVNGKWQPLSKAKGLGGEGVIPEGKGITQSKEDFLKEMSFW